MKINLKEPAGNSRQRFMGWIDIIPSTSPIEAAWKVRLRLYRRRRVWQWLKYGQRPKFRMARCRSST